MEETDATEGRGAPSWMLGGPVLEPPPADAELFGPDDDPFFAAAAAAAVSTAAIAPMVLPFEFAAQGDDTGLKTEPTTSPEVTSSPASSALATPLQPADITAASAAASVAAIMPQTVCRHCWQRLMDMRESSSAKCREGALKWERNWHVSGLACFGACESAEFCVEHGLPLAICRERFSDFRHAPFLYRGSWVQVRSRHSTAAASVTTQQAAAATTTTTAFVEDDDSGGSTAEVSKKRQRKCDEVSPSLLPPPPHQQQSLSASTAAHPAPSAPPAAVADSPLDIEPSPVSMVLKECTAPGECLRRLQKLLLVDWVSLDAAVTEAVKRLEMAAREGCCQGLCATPYCCRIHWCPAYIRRPLGTASRYHCRQGPHDHSNRKGRHHADFGFYCSDPACCNGKWFSRDETHKRSRRAVSDKKLEAQQEQHHRQPPPSYDQVGEPSGPQLQVVELHELAPKRENRLELASAPSINELVAATQKTPGASDSEDDLPGDDRQGSDGHRQHKQDERQHEDTPLVSANRDGIKKKVAGFFLGQIRWSVPAVALVVLLCLLAVLLFTVIGLAVKMSKLEPTPSHGETICLDQQLPQR